MQKTDLDEFRCQRGRLRRFVRVARKPTNEGFPFLAIAFGADTLLSRCGKRARGVNFSIVYEIVRESFRPICYYFWPPTPSRKSIGDVRFLLEFRGANRHRIVLTIAERQRDCFFFFISVSAYSRPILPENNRSKTKFRNSCVRSVRDGEPFAKNADDYLLALNDRLQVYRITPRGHVAEFSPRVDENFLFGRNRSPERFSSAYLSGEIFVK